MPHYVLVFSLQLARGFLILLLLVGRFVDQTALELLAAPIIFGSDNMETIGYAEHLVLPIKLTPVDAAHPIKLELSAQLGICLDICVPIFLSLSQQLDPVQRSADPATLLALENQPVPRAQSNLQYLDCAVTPDEDAILITIGAAIPSLGARETLIIEYKQQNHWVMERDYSRFSLSKYFYRKDRQLNDGVCPCSALTKNYGALLRH